MSRTHIKTRIRVWHDDDTVVDLSTRIVRGPTRSGDIDTADWTVAVTFDNRNDYINANLSLDPLDELSTLNLDSSGNFDPILTENHVVMIEVDEGAGWVVWFDGYAGGDVNSVVVNTKRNTVTFSPDGVIMPLKEKDRLEKITYSDRDLATSLLQSILLDSGFKGRLSHVVISDDPTAQVDEYTTKVGSTWDALQTAVAKTGYILASRYHAATTAYNDGSEESTSVAGFYLTLYDPIRSKTTVDYTWTDECVRRNVRYSIDDVRTWVHVAFEDAGGAQQHTPSTSNAESRAKFGIPAGDGTKIHRQMRIVEDNNSLINTMAEAIAYRDFALHDLETPIPNTSIIVDELWSEPKLHDLVEFQFTDYTIKIGITGIDTKLDPSEPWGETTFTGVIDKVIGLRNYWLGQELTEEELAKRRREFLEGGAGKLPKPVILHVRPYAKQGNDGETYTAAVVSWERVDSWWYGSTDIYISVGDNKHYGEDPFMSARGTFATVQPLPAGQSIYVKLKHIPNVQITQQGRR